MDMGAGRVCEWLYKLFQFIAVFSDEALGLNQNSFIEIFVWTLLLAWHTVFVMSLTLKRAHILAYNFLAKGTQLLFDRTAVVSKKASE